jgi:hypothetical protein
MEWVKGRGKLGIFVPLLGTWQAQAESEMGPVVCRRTFTRVLDGKYIQLEAQWTYPSGSYDELALFGANKEKEVCFWSFTSDGKQSQGVLAEAVDLHPQAVGFEAHMDAGLARQVYWPDEGAGFHWVVESKTKKGWKRFVAHHYKPVDA